MKNDRQFIAFRMMGTICQEEKLGIGRIHDPIGHAAHAATRE